MSTDKSPQLALIITKYENELLEVWLSGLMTRMIRRDKNAEAELRQQATRFLPLLVQALDRSTTNDIEAAAWDDTRHMLTDISQARVRQGFSSIETASFIFALKEPLFAYLRTALADNPIQLVEETAATSALFDRLGLFTIEVYQKAREQVILRQQQELLELSTPVVQLWEGVLALPLIGTLDSARTQVVMENLLQKIVDTGASIAIIDITGVPTVDTLVAQHLLKTIAAARLMGADCIISGIRPQIAQTIVHLGVNLEDVVTKATLADAFVVALKRTGSTITHPQNVR
ncbi:STAS domain-containing protein [Massilia scottii]|uniref:STAS domain-containing protein n=1 Tax=Massilia scottii TaxID=3057166 RepID=UPI002796DE1F|nr:MULTISPECIES: STAS domain-containing protein [unclassified Massilia]MDQ1813968.1 STAS domain-containing protein [Massilia sp. CCM 9210]MDQ1829440.1 STAS domain-containing protein [Massilia sp. CCM 9029]